MRRKVAQYGELAKTAKTWIKEHFPGENYTQLASLLSRVATRAYGKGFNEGYAVGHED